MLVGMIQNSQTIPLRPSTEADISALLDMSQQAESIIDGLMNIPVSGSQSDWDSAVARRLEQRLARTMRAMLEGDGQRRSA